MDFRAFSFSQLLDARVSPLERQQRPGMSVNSPSPFSRISLIAFGQGYQVLALGEKHEDM